ncbi:MAG: hypothetical protein IIC39_00955 [Candidatus Marinimicrobia bacterium]|nr:hypothetical protein [Candidatus Neomarinimicrobiota bacterium]
MKKIITSRLVLLSILIFANAAMAFAQERKGEKGFSVTLTNKGFGIGLSYNRNNGPASMFTSNFEIINVNGKNELTGQFFNQFTGRYEQFKVGDENLLLMPLMFGYRKNMWHDQIANNFQPYIQLSSGPVLAFDMKEEELDPENPFAINTQEKVGFIEQFSKGKAYYTIGVSISAGAVIETSKHRFINISVNYSLIDYGRNLDKRRAFGGLAFRVEFGSWIR